MSSHVSVNKLEVSAGKGDSKKVIVKDVSFTLKRGEVLALIGESGSGKTTIAMSLLGYARPGCYITGGEVAVGGQSMLGLSDTMLASLRGRKVAYVAQSAAAAFNPSRKIMEQVIEGALIHGAMSRADAQKKATELFRQLSLPHYDTIGNRYPHEVSGGQLQRLMAAMALICDPELVIFDEPTTALDVTTQVDVLKAFKAAVKARNTTAVYVSHDLAVVAQMADQILVLQHGKMVEHNTTTEILNHAAEPYTGQLLAAVSHGASGLNRPTAKTVLEVSNVVAGYGKITAAGLPQIPVLHDVSIKVEKGKTVGIIGESGSGKSTFARVITGLIPAAKGYMLLDGKELPASVSSRSKSECQRVQMVFQNADTALNPAQKVGDIIGRPLAFFHGMKGEQQRARVAELLALVQLPVELAERKCGALSGGQKQRINLARALAAEPSVILCDEVTSALDTVVAAAILELLKDLQAKLNIAIVFISHDIPTVRTLCDDVLVLYKGNAVEYASGEAVSTAPSHDYTKKLVASVPTLDPGWLDSRPPAA